MMKKEPKIVAAAEDDLMYTRRDMDIAKAACDYWQRQYMQASLICRAIVAAWGGRAEISFGNIAEATEAFMAIEHNVKNNNIVYRIVNNP